MEVLINLNPTEARVHADTCLFTKGNNRGVAECTEVIVIAERKAIRWHLFGRTDTAAMRLQYIYCRFLSSSNHLQVPGALTPVIRDRRTMNHLFWRAERGRHTVS